LPRQTPLRTTVEAMQGPKQTAELHRRVTLSRATSLPFQKALPALLQAPSGHRSSPNRDPEAAWSQEETARQCLDWLNQP
jgi:hypothetical protein